MSQPEFPETLVFRPRPTQPMTIAIPTDTYGSLTRMAAEREMSVDALVKLYIGHGLRTDLAKHFTDHVLEITARILTEHGQPPEQVAAIVRDIRAASEV
jgi:hypothetical protein